MKKWEKPMLEELDVRMTMNGKDNKEAETFDEKKGELKKGYAVTPSES